MLGKFKDAAAGAGLQKAVDAISPKLMEHLEKLRALDPSVVRDDGSFAEQFVKPTLLALGASTGGVTSLVPGFNERFGNAMLHMRNELLVLDGEKIAFADGYQERLPTVMLEGLKNP